MKTDIAIASVLGGALVATLAMWALMRSAPPPARVERFVIPTPAEAPPLGEINSALAMSPDGSRVVYRTTTLDAPIAQAMGLTFLGGRVQQSSSISRALSPRIDGSCQLPIRGSTNRCFWNVVARDHH